MEDKKEVKKNDKSTQQKNELFNQIWKIADELRGQVDGWDFKQYILGFLFYRYISDDFAQYIDNIERQDNKDFQYKMLSDSEITDDHVDDIVKEKGYFIYPSQLLENILKNCDEKNLNEKLIQAFKSIEESANGKPSEENVKGLFSDIDLNSNKLGKTVIDRNKKIRLILERIKELKLGNFQDSSIDIFGDAYEFLMAMYASSAGKSGGEFFTPQEVSELLVRLAIGDKKEINKIYDPACGSGSLLLKASKFIEQRNILEGYFGQEINITTYNLCRINMFLHGINYGQFSIAHDNTLLSPHYYQKGSFDAIVSNPPYSIKWPGSDDPTLINDDRYCGPGVLAPKNNADYAFILHSLYLLSTQGKAAIVCFPGILYRKNAEEKIRKYLIDNNYIDLIIQLPANLFFGTSITTSIMVLSKSKKEAKTMFIDATNEFVKVTNSNKLSEENIEKILNTYNNRKEIQYFSKIVDNQEIANNNYDLSVSQYVEQKDNKEIIDIKVLNNEIDHISENINSLRQSISKIVKEIENG